MTNILQMVNNFANNPIKKLKEYYLNSTRIQQVGEALEYYIKDLFCNTINIKDKEEKELIYSKYFSYFGNKNNPPDIILKGGDAIEIKKIENNKPLQIALNSSYPKNKLYKNDSFINQACKNCEDWDQKDMIYIIGSVYKNILHSLWIVYGESFCACPEIYQRIKNSLSTGINKIENVDFAKTKELGRVDKVDPLGITYLRIRGMWGIAHPRNVFNLDPNPDDNLLNLIILKSKYNSFSKEDIKKLINNSKIKIKNIKIKNPNNPVKLEDAKYIYIRREL